MFKVEYINYGVTETYTVYAVDRPTESFLIVNQWGSFEWIPMDRCWIKED